MSQQFPRGTQLLVSSSTARNLDFFDPSTGEKIATLKDLLAEPHEIAFDAGRRLAYITHTYRTGVYAQDVPKAHEISVIDVDEHLVREVIDITPYYAPHDVEFDPVLDLIITGVEYVDGRRGILLIDAETHEVEADIVTAAPNCHWLALVPGRKLYVAHKEAEFLSVVDLVARRVTSTIPLPGGAEEVDASANGDFVFAVTPQMKADVDLGGSGHMLRRERNPGDPVPRVVKIDVDSNQIVDQLEFDDYQLCVRVGEDLQVFVTCMNFLARPDDKSIDLSELPRNNGFLHLIDGRSMTLTGQVEVEQLPMTIRVAPDGGTAWISNLGSGTVAVVDVASRSMVRTFDNNAGGGYGGTHGLAFVPPRDE